MTEYGFQGTALGTLVMPFCSGLGNLLFVYIVAERGGLECWQPQVRAVDRAGYGLRWGQHWGGV